MKPPPERRYRYEQKQLTREEAAKIKRRKILLLQSSIDELEEELRETRQALKDTVKEPLLTEQTIQITLYKGDPGFDEASPVFDPAAYQGDIEWVEKK